MPNVRKLTKEDEQSIVAMYKLGHTITEILEFAPCSRQTIYRTLRAWGINPERKQIIDGKARCTVCKQMKPLQNLSKKNRCAPCRLDLRLQQAYGITLQERNAKIAEQGHVCAICTKPMKNPHVDHCHKTGKVRGILCGRCNMGLGQFKHNPSLLKRAISYL